MRTIAVIALKGGSGKTTVASHIALAAHRRGLDTVLIDTDPQASARDVFSAREEPGPLVATGSGPELMMAQFDAVGAKRDLMVIDTAAGAVEDVSEALVLADLSILVVRPTLLDIAGMARSYTLVRRLGKPVMVVMNQAPVAREGSEAPLVKRAMKALDYMRAPVAPVIIRSRSIYQTGLERGRSAEESQDKAAAQEIADLWGYVKATLDEAKAA